VRIRAHSDAIRPPPSSGVPAQCRPTGTFRPESRHRAVPIQHSEASGAVNFCAALRQCAHVRFRRVSCMTLWRHVMATAAARRASDDDLRVCCASRVARPADIRISRPHRAEKPNVPPPSCRAEFVRRFGAHRIGARRPRVDVKDRGMSRLPRCDRRVVRATSPKNGHGNRHTRRFDAVRPLPHRTSMCSRFATAFFIWPASPAPSFRPQAPYSSSPRLRTRSSDRVNGAPGVVLKPAHGGARRDDDLVFGAVDVHGW
jgi:hypothetical protein